MLKAHEAHTLALHDADVVVEELVKARPDAAALRSEYLFGSDMSAWVEQFIFKYNVQSPQGRPLIGVSSDV